MQYKKKLKLFFIFIRFLRKMSWVFFSRKNLTIPITRFNTTRNCIKNNNENGEKHENITNVFRFDNYREKYEQLLFNLSIFQLKFF